MTTEVPRDEIEAIVGRKRHPTEHFWNIRTDRQMVYILHSQECLNLSTRLGESLNDCAYSWALDELRETGVLEDRIHDGTFETGVPRELFLDVNRGTMYPLREVVEPE